MSRQEWLRLKRVIYLYLSRKVFKIKEGQVRPWYFMILVDLFFYPVDLFLWLLSKGALYRYDFVTNSFIINGERVTSEKIEQMLSNQYYESKGNKK